MLYAEYSSFGILTDYDLDSSRLIHCTKIGSHFTYHTYCKITGLQSQQTNNVETTSYERRRIDVDASTFIRRCLTFCLCWSVSEHLFAAEYRWRGGGGGNFGVISVRMSGPGFQSPPYSYILMSKNRTYSYTKMYTDVEKRPYSYIDIIIYLFINGGYAYI